MKPADSNIEPFDATDEVLEELYRVRAESAAEYGTDLKRYFDDLRKLEAQYADRVVDLSAKAHNLK